MILNLVVLFLLSVESKALIFMAPRSSVIVVDSTKKSTFIEKKKLVK